MKKDEFIYLNIVKSYNSSATEHSTSYEIEGVSNLLGFLNDSINMNDDIFTGLTYNDPGDETWTLTIGHIPPFKIKTWYELNLFIKGLLVSATYEWL